MLPRLTSSLPYFFVITSSSASDSRARRPVEQRGQSFGRLVDTRRVPPDVEDRVRRPAQHRDLARLFELRRAAGSPCRRRVRSAAAPAVRARRRWCRTRRRRRGSSRTSRRGSAGVSCVLAVMITTSSSRGSSWSIEVTASTSTTSLPSAVRSVKPCSRIASACAGRVTRATSAPPCRRRPPITLPTAPAP